MLSTSVNNSVVQERNPGRARVHALTEYHFGGIGIPPVRFWVDSRDASVKKSRRGLWLQMPKSAGWSFGGFLYLPKGEISSTGPKGLESLGGLGLLEEAQSGSLVCLGVLFWGNLLSLEKFRARVPTWKAQTLPLGLSVGANLCQVGEVTGSQLSEGLGWVSRELCSRLEQATSAKQ